jgi:uncharacterized protein (TIGR03437 family)
MAMAYAANGQINGLVSQYIAPGRNYPMVVTTGTFQSAPVTLSVVEFQPGIYTVDTSGAGPGIVANALTGQLINASNPAHTGDYLVIYCTGLGAVRGPNGELPAGDGGAAPSTPLFSTTATVTATIGGVATPVLYSGLTPTFAELYQVNVQVPTGVAAGNSVPLVLKTTNPGTGASALSNLVTIAVQ